MLLVGVCVTIVDDHQHHLLYVVYVVDVCSYTSSSATSVNESDGDDSSSMQQTVNNRSEITACVCAYVTVALFCMVWHFGLMKS